MEKEEEQRARDKIKVKLEEDRKERRRKLGLPEEPTDEEKARDAEKAEATQKAAEEKKLKAFVPPKPIGVLEKVRTAMLAMKKSAGSEGPEFERYKVALSTLSKYIGNVAAHPGEEKYRTIKLTNAAFQSRVGGVSGSLEVLALAGFVKESDEAMVMPASSASPEALSAISTAITDALSNPFFGLL
ncbi:hypothetical protein FOA52_008804 [Chlamydomonas sp. UWO 241]|nr:hypothetical protein FOA52_008804 [Chlamydomonas sp. UWO 241]